MLVRGLEWSHGLFQHVPDLDSQGSPQSTPKSLFRHSQ